MKTKAFVILFIFIAGLSLSVQDAGAQSHRLSTSLFYPIPDGNSFYSNYTGIAGLDLEYGYYIYETISVGARMGYSRASYKLQDNSVTYSNLYRWQGFLLFPVDVGDTWQLALQPALGYARIAFRNGDFGQNIEQGWDMSFNATLEIPLDEGMKLGLFSSYDFIYLGKPRNGPDIPYNTDMYYFTLGARLVWVYR